MATILGKVTIYLNGKPSYKREVATFKTGNLTIISFGWPIEYNVNSLNELLEHVPADQFLTIDAAGRNLGAPATVAIGEVKEMLKLITELDGNNSN